MSHKLNLSNVTVSNLNQVSGNSPNRLGEGMQQRESGLPYNTQVGNPLNKKFSNHLAATPTEVLNHISAFAKYDRDRGGFVRTATTKGPQHNQVIGDLIGCTADGYRKLAILGCKWIISRLVWAAEYGEWPPGEVDHINGNTFDDHIDNLRVGGSVLNGGNKKLYANNKTGYVGVKLHAATGKYHSQATINKKRYHIGVYLTAEEATNARANFLSQINHQFTTRHGSNTSDNTLVQSNEGQRSAIRLDNFKVSTPRK